VIRRWGAPTRAADLDAKRAQAALEALMDNVGDTGLAIADVAPGLRAAVDQHAAAIRDSLDLEGTPMTWATLVGYAHGLREAATAHGWHFPTGPVDWTRADWVLTRLLAVCDLGRAAPATA